MIRRAEFPLGGLLLIGLNFEFKKTKRKKEKKKKRKEKLMSGKRKHWRKKEGEVIERGEGGGKRVGECKVCWILIMLRWIKSMETPLEEILCTGQ